MTYHFDPPSRVCAYCREPFAPKRAVQMFCRDKCRIGYHVDVGMTGKISSVRKLRGGSVLVVMRLQSPAADAALSLQVDDVARIVVTP